MADAYDRLAVPNRTPTPERGWKSAKLGGNIYAMSLQHMDVSAQNFMIHMNKHPEHATQGPPNIPNNYFRTPAPQALQDEYHYVIHGPPVSGGPPGSGQIVMGLRKTAPNPQSPHIYRRGFDIFNTGPENHREGFSMWADKHGLDHQLCACGKTNAQPDVSGAVPHPPSSHTPATALNTARERVPIPSISGDLEAPHDGHRHG